MATKRESANVNQLGALGDSRTVELQNQLEIAEERDEVAESELEEVKGERTVIAVEVELLKSGSGSLGDGGEEASTKIQLEKKTERLKEALRGGYHPDLDAPSHQVDANLRLRDVANLGQLRSLCIPSSFSRQP